LNYQNNYVERSKSLEYQKLLQFFAVLLIISNKIILIVQQNYFQICIQQNFRSLSKIVFSVW